MDLGDTVTISEARFVELLNHERISKELNGPRTPAFAHFVKYGTDQQYERFVNDAENWGRLINTVNCGDTVEDILALIHPKKAGSV